MKLNAESVRVVKMTLKIQKILILLYHYAIASVPYQAYTWNS